jgi:hypothetical protein
VKIVNRSRIFEILRNYFFLTVALYIGFVTMIVISQEKMERFMEFMPPELAGLQIISVSLFALVVAFVFFSVASGLHVYKVLGSEYLRVWDSFVEGPTEQGERVVLSFAQIKYMGKDLLGRYCLDSGDFKVILPGKLSASTERTITRLIGQARLKDNL